MSSQTALSISSEFGFAGAPLVGWQFLVDFGKAGDLVFFGCDREISRRYGRTNSGAADYVRASTSMTALAPPGTYDLGTIASSNPANAISEIAETADRIVTTFGGLPVLIACDHTASLGALLGNLKNRSEAPIYLYFDAHFDLGRNCTPDDLIHNGGFVGEILRRKWAHCAINVGGRSVTANLPYLATPGFVNIPAYRSKHATVGSLAPLAGETIYVSIDADVLDPAEAPNVSCPEPNGMLGENLLACCKWLGQNCNVIGADLTEILPSTNSRDSERLLMICLLALQKRSETFNGNHTRATRCQ